MADIKEMRIFCAEQIEVPDALPEILKNYSKAVIRENPENIISFSRKYFENLKYDIVQANAKKQENNKTDMYIELITEKEEYDEIKHIVQKID